MTEEAKKALNIFQKTVEAQIAHTQNSIDFQTLSKATEMIQTAINNHGRLHVTGIGKSGHVAEYIASLITSTGTPTYFLHGTEAVHGSSGQLVSGDVVIGISNSGNTEELISTILCAKNNGCKIIGVTADPTSRLGRESDVCLKADMTSFGEGGPLNRAPRASILAQEIVLMYLSVILQADAHVTPEEYVMHHPHGALGKLRKNEI